MYLQDTIISFQKPIITQQSVLIHLVTRSCRYDASLYFCSHYMTSYQGDCNASLSVILYTHTGAIDKQWNMVQIESVV